MRTLYLECAMGASGDMLMGALYELLDDKPGFLRTMNGLGLPGVHISAHPAHSHGIAGTHMEVLVHGEDGDAVPAGRCHEHDNERAHGHEHENGLHHGHGHATPGTIGALIDSLPLPEEVRLHAREVYGAIARAEAAAHGCEVSDVHFHEVGALDAVADVVGVCLAMHMLRPDKVAASPVHVGSGTVRCAHGVLPVPAPATARLLTGVPVYGGEVQGELCTPTGAALISHFAEVFGSLPLMSLDGMGIGMGSRDFGRPNCLRAFLGGDSLGTDGISELVCNIDDMTPEALAYASSRILESGALDVYVTPGTMKKGRSGHVLTVLCAPGEEGRLARRVMEETVTNGLRLRRCEKYQLRPGRATVSTPWGEVRLKTAEGAGILHVKPEHDDVAALARENGLSYAEVWQAAMDSRGKE